MIHDLVHILETYILPLGPFGVFLASIIEEVVAPIPSAAVIFLSGFLFLKGLSGLMLFKALIFEVALPAALGVAIGSLFVYVVGFYFGKPFFEKWGNYLGVTWGDIERARAMFSRGPRDEITLITLRAIPIVPSVVISGVAGVMRIPWKTYLLTTFIGFIPRIMILGYLGAIAGDAYEIHAESIKYYENIVLVVLVILTISFFAFRYIRHKKVIQ